MEMGDKFRFCPGCGSDASTMNNVPPSQGGAIPNYGNHCGQQGAHNAHHASAGPMPPHGSAPNYGAGPQYGPGPNAYGYSQGYAPPQYAMPNPYCQPYGMSGDYVGAYKKKSEGTATIMSVLWPGLGQLYIGKVPIGLLFMFSYVLIGGAGLLGSFFSYGLLFAPLAIICPVLMFVVWVMGIYTANKWAKEYNRALYTTGNPPW